MLDEQRPETVECERGEGALGPLLGNCGSQYLVVSQNDHVKRVRFFCSTQNGRCAFQSSFLRRWSATSAPGTARYIDTRTGNQIHSRARGTRCTAPRQLSQARRLSAGVLAPPSSQFKYARTWLQYLHALAGFDGSTKRLFSALNA